MGLELLFLGTGTSAGVPMIGCDCAVCHSHDPRDRRDRPSVLVSYPARETAGDPPRRSFLIDTTPELRLQAMRHRLHRLDGVLITHAHMDHVAGLDDLRRFNAVMDAPLELYGEASVLERLEEMFRHIFQPQKNRNASFVASLIPRAIEAGESLDLGGARWTPLRLMHGRLPVLGFRIDWQGQSLAYCTDVSTIPPETYPLLKDLDVLVLDALRYRAHPTHLTVDRALEVVTELQPRQTYFTHIAHDISHRDVEPTLPAGVNLAYDNLRISCAAPEAGDISEAADESHHGTGRQGAPATTARGIPSGSRRPADGKSR
jgi:phosphoribosyl 1,2-cyclic phosphate phosphodiesterase